MQVKIILYTLSVLNTANALAFPKRETELRNRKDDVILNKRLPKQIRKGQLPDVILNKRSPKQVRKGRETELRNLPDVILNKRSPKQSRTGRETIGI